jgi:YYY domain-containing protein
MTRARLLVPALLVSALAVRLFGIDWDQRHHFHPDERRIAEAVTRISFVPPQLDPDFFAYGSFPFYVTRAAMGTLGLLSSWFRSYDAAVLVGRGLSAVWGAATVWLVILLGRRLFGERPALLGGALLAAAVLHVQNSHFGVNDVALGFLVTATLLLLVRGVQDGRDGPLLAAAACAGLALATKVSAAPVLLPVAVAVVQRARGERVATRILGLGAAAAALTAACFAIGEPYALIKASRFLNDVAEQGRMVRQAGVVPYTNQYVGVPKLWYDLREMVLWGMGPPLGIAALAGAAWSAARSWRRLDRALPWLWFAPFFVITVSFDVKFMRYLLPAYPLLALWAGAWLDSLVERTRWGRAARATVLAGSALYLLAFLAIYTRPHTVVAASEWFYREVPAGSRVLTQEWDEGFPLHLPGGRTPGRYSDLQLPFYENDSEGKIARLAGELAGADMLVLPTKRLYGAVTQAGEKFPRTVRFFQMLFAGDLGYTLEREFASRPALLGIELPTELADESFSVYDHPKVLVFRNTGRLPAAEITARALHGIPSHPMPRRAMLLARPEQDPGPLEGRRRASLPALLLWIALLEALGLAACVLLQRAGWPEEGLYPLAKVLGVLLFAYPVWLAVSLGWVRLSVATLQGWALGIVIVAWLAWRSRRWLPGRAEVTATEAAFWGVFALFLALRALNPEVFWGEKPMDFAFLNTLYRIDALPPPEPWFAGSPLNYTYFGHFVAAALGRATGSHPAVAFNLAIAAFAALTAAALFAAGVLLTGRRRGGALAVGVTLLLGNLSVLRELPARRVLNFDTFWATSRVIKDTINEYPFWSFSFADLHAHVLAIPFAVSLLALLLVWRHHSWDPGVERPAVARLTLALAGAVVFGAITVTSGWSLPTAAALVVGLLGLGWVSARPAGARGRWSSLLTEVLLPAAAILAGATLAFRPFWSRFTPPPRNWGWERGPWARPTDVLLIFGLFAIVLVPFLVGEWRERLRARGRWPVVAFFVLLLLACVDLRALAGMHLRPARSVFVAALTIAALAAFVALHPGTGHRSRMSAALTALAAGILAGCEAVFVWDRMNTVFKYYLEAWLLLGVASAAVLDERWPPAQRPGGRWWRLAVVGAGAVALATSVTGAIGLLRGRHVAGPRPTLDGMAYLKTFNPLELEAYEWLNANVPGTPAIAEAQGPSYQQFARVSMNTGLPALLGWEYHVFQRGQAWPQIHWRRQDVQTIYVSPEREAVEAALRRHRVAFVFVGPLELRTYGERSLERFALWSDLLRPVFRNQGVTIFAVTGRGGVVPAAVPPPPPTPTPQPQDAAGVLREPRGLACDAAGGVLVCDFGNHRIQRFGPDLAPLAAFGERGSRPRQFDEPCGVAVGPDGRIYVADTWNSRVQVFRPDGSFVLEWAASFYGPRGIAVAADGRVFVVDSGNRRVVRFAPDGVQEREWRGDEGGGGPLLGPVGIAVDAAGRVLVCDNDAGRLRIFDRDGRHLRAIEVPGWRREVFSEPYLAIDADGLLWVTVPLAGEVRAYSYAGQLVRTIPGDAGASGFDRPIGIAFRAADRRLLLTDLSGRVVALSPAAAR